MNEQLANMIARSEHTQRHTSTTPILDFDRRGEVYTPGWLEQGISALFHGMSNLAASLKDRLRQQPVMTRDTSISENHQTAV